MRLRIRTRGSQFTGAHGRPDKGLAMASAKVRVLIDALVIGCAVLTMVPPEQFLGPVTKYHSLNG